MNFSVAFVFFKYLLLSKSRHGVHSPFVYGFVENVIQNKSEESAFSKVKTARKELLKNHKEINFTDFGAQKGEKKRVVSKVAKRSGVSAKYGRILFKTAKYFDCKQILEFGTSLGISGSYLALSPHTNRFVTMEGCKNIASIAENTFENCGIKNAQIEIGDFDKILPNVISTIDKIDLVFFDGNHTEKATIEYFNSCLPLIHNDTVFVFDDIHWSKGMEKAWEKIKENPKVTISIDIFRMGFVFFRKESSKEHFVIRT